MTLYEINKKILECVDPDTGEVDAEALIALEEEKDEKIDNVAKWILDLTADVAKIDAETERLKKMKDATKKKIESLKKFLGYACENQNRKRDTFQIRFTRSKKVELDPLQEVPDEYMAVKITSEPDKMKIRKAIETGEEIPFAELVETVSCSVK